MLVVSSELQTCRYCNSKSLIGFYFCPYCGLNQDETAEYSREEIEAAKMTATINMIKTLKNYGKTIPMVNVPMVDIPVDKVL